jgi:simple sugar transport system permease protein
MLISLLGMHSPVGIIFAAIFYSALITGSESIAIFSDVPREIIQIIQALIILNLSVKLLKENSRLTEMTTNLMHRILPKKKKDNEVK